MKWEIKHIKKAGLTPEEYQILLDIWQEGGIHVAYASGELVSLYLRTDYIAFGTKEFILTPRGKRVVDLVEGEKVYLEHLYEKGRSDNDK